MGNEIVPFNEGRNSVTALIPQVLPGALTHGALVTAVAKAAETALRTAHALRYAAVSIRHDNEVAIQWLDESRRVLKQDVIPVMAIAKVHHFARTVIVNADMDDDLKRDALADLELKRQRRRDRL